MSSGSFPVKSVTEIQAIIGKFTKISGEPKLRDLLKLQDEAIVGSQKFNDHARGPLGYLYTVIPLAAYQLYTAVPLILPTDPGDGPNLAGLPAFGHHVDEAKIEWEKANQAWKTHKNVNLALRGLMIDAIDDSYVQDIHSDPQVLANPSFIDYFAAYVNEYGCADQEEIAQVLSEMDTPWDPETMSVPKLIRQMQNGIRYSQYVGEPMTEATILRRAENLILGLRKMPNEYSEWMSQPDVDRTWLAFQEFFKRKHRLWKISHRPAANYGYGGAASQGTTSASESNGDDDYINEMNMAMNAMNKASFDMLSQQLTSMQQHNQFLQQQLAAAMQGSNQQPAQPQQQYQAPPPQQQQYQYQPPPQQQYQAPPAQQQYQQQQQNYGGRGGRGGGRGYGRGGGRGYGRGGGRGSGRGNYNQGQYNQQQQQQGGQGQNFYQNQNQQNPVKRHDNWFYCWSHGFDVDHDSMHCMNQKWGHQIHATRNNCMGGCQAKKHKTVLPSQASGYNNM